MILEVRDILERNDSEELENLVSFIKEFDESSSYESDDLDENVESLEEEVEEYDHMLVYKEDDKFVGILCVTDFEVLADVTYDDGMYYIQNLYVTPSCRHKGIAKALLNEAISIVRKEGRTSIMSSYMEDNDSSKLWHRKNGFFPAHKEVFVELKI